MDGWCMDTEKEGDEERIHTSGEGEGKEYKIKG